MKPRQTLLALALAAAVVPTAWSADLLEVWRAAAGHDPEFAAARAARAAGQARRDQASALWRPTVALEGGVGRATHESATRGAQFSAPGFGESTGVNFDTSVTNGTSTRYALSLRQPLYNRERSVQGAQLNIAADMAELEWRAAEQSLMLRSAEHYFAAALAAQQLRLLREQEGAVEKARVEAQDRFRIGDRPVTDVHEATARASALHAQRLAAQSELEVRQAMLADFSGLAADTPLPLPLATPGHADLGPLAAWLDRAARENPQVLLAEAQLRLAEQEARKTDAAFSPTLDLVAQVGRDRLSGSGDFGNASQTGTQRAIGVQLSLPLYTGGQRSARHTETRALAEKASADLDRARQQVAQQTRAAWLDLTSGRSRTAALEAGLQASLARLDATRVGLQAGDRTTLDLLNAQNDAAAAELALLQARVRQLTQRLRLAALAGQLDEAGLGAINRELGAATAAAPAGTLAPMVAFDALYIPALAASSSATQDAQAAPRARATFQALQAQWPAQRTALAAAWGPATPAAWAATLGEVDRLLAAAAQATQRGDWPQAHEDLEQVRIQLMKGRQAQGLDYFVDRLTAYHEPMETLALAGSRTPPAQLTPQLRSELRRAHAEARTAWAGIEQFRFSAADHGLDGARLAQFTQGMADERAALDALGQALAGADDARLLRAAAALKPPFARVFTAFGRFEAPPQR